MMRPGRTRVSACLLLAAVVVLPGAVQGGDSLDFELGKQVFLEIAEPQCALCHTLAAAGASGQLAPSLDQLRPSADEVEEVVRDGVDVMPAYGDMLTEEQIKAVAHYVATVAGQP